MNSKQNTKLKNYYYPGWYFQNKFSIYYNKPFEERYARKSAIRTYLYCLNKISLSLKININSDVSSYILSFLIPEEIGVEVKIQKNTNIKKYTSKTKIINPCIFGHTHEGPIECFECCRKRIEYEMILLKIELIDKSIDFPYPYEEISLNDSNLHSKELEMRLDSIKNKIKIQKSFNTREKRNKNFTYC